MASTEAMEMEVAGNGRQSLPQPTKETDDADSVHNPGGGAGSEPGNPAAQELAPTDESTTATPMEQDPQPDTDTQHSTETQLGNGTQLGNETQPVVNAEIPSEQVPVSQTMPPQPEPQEAPPPPSSTDPPLAMSELTEPAVDADDPAVPAEAATPAPEPVPVMPLDRADLLKTVLSGRRPDTALCRLPSKLQLPLPREGFVCDHCGERFVLPSSLALHQNRRTMEIAFKCKPCGKTCLFDNKCRFLEHLDSHSMDVQSLDPESVDVTALTSADLSSPTRVLPALGSRLLTGPPRMVKMVHAEPVHRPVDISCPMCNTLCTTDTIRAHMCPPSSEVLDAVPPRCPECAQPCPSECALLAHHGLHKPNLFPYPYVCPECSVKVLGSYDEYRRHVVAGCLHLTRDLKICCAICLIEVGDVKSHMLQTHVQKLYKCRKCPLAFESINGFNSHVKGKHSTEIMTGETPYMPILKCPFCAATFNHPKTLREHLASKKHGDRILEQVRFVFRCPECGVDYGRKELLSDHLVQSHPDFHIDIQEPTPQQPAPTPTPAPVAPAPAPAAPVLVAAPAAGRLPKNALPLTADGKPLPMPKIKLEPGRKPPAPWKCSVCPVEYRRKAAFTEHMKTHIQAGVPLCLLCNSAFDSHDMLKNHIAEHAAEIGSDRCGLCYAKLGSRDALQLHLEKEHELRDFSCPYCQLEFDSLSDLLRHNFAKHRGAAQGRPARPKPVPPPPVLVPTPAQDEDEDDLPLSQMAGKKAAIKRALPAFSAELDSENSSVKSEGSAEGKRRKKEAAARAGGRGVKRPRSGTDDGPPRLSRVKQSSSPVEKPPENQQPMYRCVCCGLQTDVRADFVAHVELHRQGSQHQCPECGQCYATKPSLLKHLLLVHRLREPPPEVAASEQQRELQQWEQLTRDLEPGQCHVCRAQCGDEDRLQRHLRMHGRAALRTHQRDQARRQRQTQPQQQQNTAEDDRAETLEAIANFVAGGGALMVEEEDGEEVIELQMKEGQITQKQLRKGVPIVHDESSDEEAGVDQMTDGQLKVKTAADGTISANGHPESTAGEQAPAQTPAANPVSA